MLHGDKEVNDGPRLDFIAQALLRYVLSSLPTWEKEIDGTNKIVIHEIMVTSWAYRLLVQPLSLGWLILFKSIC